MSETEDDLDDRVVGEGLPFVTITPTEVDALVAELIGTDISMNGDVEMAIERLGTLIDLASDFELSDGIAAAITQGGGLLARQGLSLSQRATVHYFLANAWSGAGRIRHPRVAGKITWERPEQDKEIIHLRRALGFSSASEFPATRKCQILTNLGNLMSRSGRYVDAIRYWDRALGIESNFTMALGNRAVGIIAYARLIQDPGHQMIHFRAAADSLGRVLKGGLRSTGPDALDSFASSLLRLEKAVGKERLGSVSVPYNFPQDMDKGERAYREWCLKSRLFLNDLNDLGSDPVASADVLTLPTLHTSFDAPRPNAIGFFNQLKQEYVSARYLYYEGLTDSEAHWSDKEVTLINTLDYPAYGLSLEKVKFAFRVAYSLLDKCAYFLNEYFALQIPESRVGFRTVWYNDQKQKKGLRTDLQERDNAALLALYWLAKELYEDDEDFAEALEPEAQELANIRHHLEHKYLKFHTTSVSDDAAERDSLARSLSRREFERKTLELLRMARCALIYLSFAVFIEEAERGKKVRGLTIQVPMETWPDEFKA